MWFPIAGGLTNGQMFKGVFDGQGYTISNYVASPSLYVGLFGYNAGTIRNLNVADFEMRIDNAATSGNLYVGGIVGYNAGTIERCSADNGCVYISVNNMRHGGLVAGGNAGTICDCYVLNGDVYVTQPSDEGEWACAGGLVGTNAGLIENSLTQATVSSYGYTYYDHNYGIAAIVAGENTAQGVMKNCIAFGAVTNGNYSKGDIVGYNEGTIENCYKDANLSLIEPTYTFATSMSKVQLSNSDFYTVTLSWDDTVWNLNTLNLESGHYPTLYQN